MILGGLKFKSGLLQLCVMSRLPSGGVGLNLTHILMGLARGCLGSCVRLTYCNIGCLGRARNDSLRVRLSRGHLSGGTRSSLSRGDGLAVHRFNDARIDAMDMILQVLVIQLLRPIRRWHSS